MNKKKIPGGKIGGNIAILVLFIVAIVYCTGLLRSILLKNTNEMGMALVKNYSAAQEQSLDTCEAILNISTKYIATREQSGISWEELRDGLYPFMDGLTELYGKESIQIYGSSFGGKKLVSNVPEIEAMTDYDFTDTFWYQEAAATNGETYVSPVYTDLRTGLPVVTMCKVVPETGSFLAIDLKPSCFEMSGQEIDLPERASCYLTDREGNLLYYRSAWNYEHEEFQRLVDSYRENAVCNMESHVSENVVVCF